MASADFSQFVVTTANGTVCETSTLKVLALSPHLPATSTGTSSNYWTSSFLADLSVFPSLICSSCPSGQGFAYSFLQIPPHNGHPCCSAMYFVVAYAYSGLTPVRARPWRANQIEPGVGQALFCCCVPDFERFSIYLSKEKCLFSYVLNTQVRHRCTCREARAPKELSSAHLCNPPETSFYETSSRLLEILLSEMTFSYRYMLRRIPSNMYVTTIPVPP